MKTAHLLGRPLLAVLCGEATNNSGYFPERSQPKAAWLILLVALLPGAASAAPITYNISFTLNTGTVAPTLGQFTYDSTSQIFSVFTVDWDGGVFDLTPSANAPNTDSLHCPGSTSTAAFAFAFLSESGCGSNALSWFGTPASNTLGQFRFGPLNASVTQILIGIAPDPAQDQAGGFFSISPISSAPEPSSINLCGMGAATMMILAIIRRRQAFRKI